MIKRLTTSLSSLLTICLLVSAPLLYSGKTATALMLLEIIGLLLLTIHFWRHPVFSTVYRPVNIFIWLSLGLMILHLLPIPFSVWSELPGRALYAESLTWLQLQDIPTKTYISLIPDETRIALLSLIPVLAIFFSATTLPLDKVKMLVMVFLGISVFEAALGLIQYSSNNSIFFFGIAPNFQSAQGTYLNRDHFAALMEMSLPIAIGLTMYTVGQKYRATEENDSSWIKMHETLIFGALAILILLGGIFSRSRSGVFLIIVAVLLSSIAFARHIGGKHSSSMTTLLGTIAGSVAISIGLAPILSRFVNEDHLADGRWEIFSNTIIGIKKFFPFGSGLGTFPDVYRSFQPIEQFNFINHAHNDYLELLFETGLSGVTIIAMFFALYIYGWIKLWHKRWDRFHYIQTGAGIGIGLILIHSLTDFNLHTPANMIAFAFINGLFFRKPSA